MSFLAPLFLIGALAVAAPVIFHLIKRTTKERTIFSSLMFLTPSPPRLTRRSRLEDILLLILRCLALVLLAIGFGRPFFRQAAPTVDPNGQIRHVAIVLDQSASMQRAGLWPAATAKVAEIVRGIGPGDELSVITFDRQPNTLLSFEEWKAADVNSRAQLVTGRISAIKPGWGSTHLGNAVIAAAESLDENSGEKKTGGTHEIILVTDLQSGAHLDTLQAFEWPKGIQLKVEQVKPSSTTNAGLALVNAAPDGSTDNAARVRVTNSSDSKRDNFILGWVRADGSDLVGPPITLYVPAGQSRVVAVPAPAGVTGLQQIGLRNDDEPFDNSLYLIPPEKQKLRALYFGSEADDDVRAPFYFLGPALPDTARLGVELTKRGPTAPMNPAEFKDASFFFVTEAISPSAAAQLRQEMTAGKTVLFAPKSAAAASTLAGLLESPTANLEDVKPSTYAMFGNIDFQHPIFSAFNDPRYSNFTAIKFWQYRRMKFDAATGGRTVASFDNGDPLLVEFPVGHGRLVALATTWNLADGQLGQVATKFVPLLQSILEIGAASENSNQFTVGDPLPLSGYSEAGQPITIKTPDGASVSLPAGTATFPRTDRPGIYTVTSGAKTVRLGVNLDAAESRTAPLLGDELERYGAPGAATTPDPVREARRVALQQGAETEGHQKLWRWFIIGTLAVLFLETAMAGWTVRRNTVTVESGGS